MAEKAKKNNKNLIIGICAGVLVIAVVIVAVIFATKSSLNDAYFVSDDSKYVLTVDRDILETEDKENSPRSYRVRGKRQRALLHRCSRRSRNHSHKIQESRQSQDGFYPYKAYSSS